MIELRRVIVLFAAAVCLLSGCGAGVRPEGASGQGKQDVMVDIQVEVVGHGGNSLRKLG